MTTAPNKTRSEDEEDGDRRDSVATQLVRLTVETGVSLFRATDDVAYGSVPMAEGKKKRRENHKLRSSSFASWLRRSYYVAAGKTANANAVSDAIGALEGFALYGSPIESIYLRVAKREAKHYLDLCDPNWRVVEIDAAGWRILDTPPVRFRRPRGMLPLPEPKQRGSLDLLRPFLNVDGEDGWRLAVAWILAALRPCGPYPLMVLSGQQGSAKSTTARVLRSLVDPGRAPIRCEPKDARDLMIGANSNWILALDNLSSIPAWLSDALCRMSTGGGFSTRQLYSDDEEVIFDAQRPVILTSIEDVTTRGDLLERSLILSLPSIPESKRRPEKEFWDDFNKQYPAILGALMDVLSGAIRELPAVNLPRLPRMADFCMWATACERALKWPPGSFIESYERNCSAANDVALEASPLVAPIQQLLDDPPFWTGTASELLAKLNGLVGDKAAHAQGWPKSPQALSNKLRRITPNLAGVGIRVEHDREGRGRRRTHTLRREEKSPETSSASSAASAIAKNTEKTSDFVRTRTQTQDRPADAARAHADATPNDCVRTKSAGNAWKPAHADDADDADDVSGDFSSDAGNDGQGEGIDGIGDNDDLDFDPDGNPRRGEASVGDDRGEEDEEGAGTWIAPDADPMSGPPYNPHVTEE